MSNFQVFQEVTRGRKFIDPESNQLCCKLSEDCIPLSHLAIYKSETDSGELVLKKTDYRNAIIESTGCFIYIPEERKVQVFL